MPRVRTAVAIFGLFVTNSLAGQAMSMASTAATPADMERVRGGTRSLS